MKTWDKRPIEIRNLFNPAFCGLVLHRALVGFEEGDQNGMPFSLTLIVLPLCLQKESREIFSEKYRSYFLETIERNPQLLVGFATRVQDTLPITFEGLGFLMQLGCFEVIGGGRLRSIRNRVRKSVTGTAESTSSQKVARYLGKEFAKISDRATIYNSLGIRP